MSIFIFVLKTDMGCDFFTFSVEKPIAYKTFEGTGADRNGQSFSQHGPIIGAGFFL